jgi:hypothetical protein
VRYCIYTISFFDGRDEAVGAFLPPAGQWHTTSGDAGECRYVSLLSDEHFAQIAHEWDLRPERAEPTLGALTEFGRIDGVVYLFDAMDWNVGGVTPVREAALWVSEPGEAFAFDVV